MGQFIRAISPRTEFVIVVIIAFGYFILGSILSVVFPHSGPSITNTGLQFLLLYEVIILAVLTTFLQMRGWSRTKIGLMLSLSDTVFGIGLAIFVYVSFVVLWMILGSLDSGIGGRSGNLVASGLSYITVLAVTLINPLFEEVFVCGYIITALRKTHSVTFAANVSIAVRLIYHLYQGTAGIINIIPLGFIFAYWFAKTERLWPVIVAHAIFDYIALVFYSQA